MRSDMSHNLRKKLAASLLLWAVFLIPQTGAAAEPFAWDKRVQRGQLANGFSYYIVSGGKEMGGQVAMNLLVRAGSLDETAGQSGVAHMVEHLVFHASAAHPEGLKTHMEALGWRVGQHYNAQTNFERTLYQLTMDKRQERVDAGLKVLAEIAGGAQLGAEALERERPVILEEWRTKLGVRERMDKQRRAMLRADSLYPERPTIGTEASIRSQPVQALRAFYKDWYRPGNMALIIVGNVDEENLKAAIARAFGSLVPAALPERNPADPRLHEQLRIVRLQDAESGASQVGWVNRFATDKRQDDEGLRARMIDRIAERSLRAMVRRAAEQLPAGVASFSASIGELGASTASLGFASSVALDGHQAGWRQILQFQERVRREGLRADDIAREIDDIRRLNDKGPAQQATRDGADWLRLLVEAVGEQRPLQDPLQKQAQIRRILGQLSAADINARARHWIDAPDRVLFLIAPGRSPLTLPSAAEVLAARTALAQQALPPQLAVKKAAAAAPANLPDVLSRGAIVREDALGEGVQRWTLENGDVLVWRQMPTDTVMRFAARSGAGYGLPGAPSWQWQVAAQVARDADLAGQAQGELARWAAARKVTLAQAQTETRLDYTAQSSADQFEDVLRLYAARQMRSELAPAALAAVGAQLARQSARQPDSVNERVSKAMAELRYGAAAGAASARLPDAAALQDLASASGVQTMRARWQLMRRQPATYFLSGPLETAQAKALAERYLAGIVRTKVETPASALVQGSGYRERRLEIGIEPQGSLHAMGSQPMQWTPERAMGVAVLARIVYRSLRQELREKEAGIYRLNYKLSLDPQQQHLLSELSFTAAPERLDALWSSARRVLDGLPAQLSSAMLDEEIQKMRGDEARRASDAATLFNRLQLSYAQYGDARYLASSKELAATLSPERIRVLAQELNLTADLAVTKLLPLGAVR